MKHNTATEGNEGHTGQGIMLLFFIFLSLGFGVCASFAQTRESDANFPGQHIKNADYVINISPNVNLTAKAVAMRSSINSPYAELKPAFAPHGDRLYFSRVLHPNNTGGVDDYEDIWYTLYDSNTSVWSEPLRMSGSLNNSGPNYIENVSITGDTLILGNQYLKKGKMRDGISYSVNKNGEWTFPTPIIIKDEYNLSNHGNHFVSLKMNVIISAVERAESFGHRDMYVSFWNGEYATEPVNMGGVINTDMEESSPYLACDYKTLYFASKGHNGYGGYDIFVTTRLDDSWTNWSEPLNLGPAVNGHLDEEFFSITHCGRYAIFTKQISIHNEDLYKVPIVELFKHTTQEAVVAASDDKKTGNEAVKGALVRKERHTMAAL